MAFSPTSRHGSSAHQRLIRVPHFARCLWALQAVGLLKGQCHLSTTVFGHELVQIHQIPHWIEPGLGPIQTRTRQGSVPGLGAFQTQDYDRVMMQQPVIQHQITGSATHLSRPQKPWQSDQSTGRVADYKAPHPVHRIHQGQEKYPFINALQFICSRFNFNSELF